MHPAYSVIAFTTAAGAGYGLLIGLAAVAAIGTMPPDLRLGLVGLGLALALITFGLLSSMLHLGRPGRAWRAFSQWKTSWLSREGIAAIVTYGPAGALSLGWVFGEIVPGQIAVSAWLAILCALITLWCTGMIYASLPTILAWHQPLVAPVYVVLGLATGSVLLTLLFTALGAEVRCPAAASAAALVAGWLMKAQYWSAIDAAPKIHTAEAATGLGRFGSVRPLDPPHTQPNYVMREMGYQVARRHARTLRRIATLLLFAGPLAASLLLLLVDGPAGVRVAAAAISTLSAGAGVLVERWLFFAEAEHVVTIYYRGGAA